MHPQTYLSRAALFPKLSVETGQLLNPHNACPPEPASKNCHFVRFSKIFALLPFEKNSPIQLPSAEHYESSNIVPSFFSREQLRGDTRRPHPTHPRQMRKTSLSNSDTGGSCPKVLTTNRVQESDMVVPTQTKKTAYPPPPH